MPNSFHLPTLLLATSLTLVYASGCATLKLPLSKTEKIVTADARNPVTQVMCIWQPAEGRGLDDMPARGFAGQIVFLTANSATPVAVEGDVTIYLFDDQGTAQERSRPLHVFRFVDGSWKAHLRSTAWGPTYQLFIPYIRPGTHRAACSLAVQIEPHEGRRVTSEMANIVLAGTEAQGNGEFAPFRPEHHRFPAGRMHGGSASGQAEATGVRPASAQAPAGSRNTSGSAPRFESFSIPYDFQRAGTP